MNWRMQMVGVAAIAVVAMSGCNRMRGAGYAGPGPASYQRAEAEQYDPYPDNDIGPPVVGGRPPDYEYPRAETTRARWNRPLSWLGY